MKREKAIPAAVFGLIFILALGIWNYILIGKNNQGVSETSQASCADHKHRRRSDQ